MSIKNKVNVLIKACWKINSSWGPSQIIYSQAFHSVPWIPVLSSKSCFIDNQSFHGYLLWQRTMSIQYKLKVSAKRDWYFKYSLSEIHMTFEIWNIPFKLNPVQSPLGRWINPLICPVQLGSSVTIYLMADRLKIDKTVVSHD